MIRKLRIAILTILFIFTSSIPVYAEGEIEISSTNDLLKMKEDPSGAYILTDNIDMKDSMIVLLPKPIMYSFVTNI